MRLSRDGPSPLEVVVTLLPPERVLSLVPYYLRDRLTIVKDLKKEIKEGLLVEMCRQLGINKADL